MNRPLLQKRFVQILAWSAVVLCSTALALAQESASAQRTDGQIEMDVVQALDASQPLKNDLITAATIQGEVTLSGTVASDSSRKLAESVVAKVNGVSKVHNNLKVGNPQEAAAAQNLPAPADDPSAGQGQGQYQDQGQQADGPAGPPQAYPQQPPSADQGQYGQQQGQYPPQQGQYPGQGQYPPQGGQYPQQGQYPPPYPPGRPQYAPPQQGYAQQPQPAFRPAPGPLTIPQGTLLQLRTSEAVQSKRAKDGEPIQFVVIADVNAGGYLAIPRGAVVHGVISEVKNTHSGDLGGSAALTLKLTSLDLGGQSYPLNSDEFKVKGPNKAGRTVGNAFGGAVLGALIGGMAGGGTGAAIGAGAGAGVGTAASAASSGPGVWIPAEARVDFHLMAPITVTQVSEQEASRLAQGLYPGGPTLYRRGPAYYGRPVVYYGYPYGYPPVYYRPYYMVGGYYSWR